MFTKGLWHSAFLYFSCHERVGASTSQVAPTESDFVGKTVDFIWEYRPHAGAQPCEAKRLGDAGGKTSAMAGQEEFWKASNAMGGVCACTSAGCGRRFATSFGDRSFRGHYVETIGV